ncbi:alpha/beta hydrolase [Nocardia sp. NPDC005366]|uniref:alpha/beta hydrolase n=1 Tax=Nocardia sp. NPDC005366 TaxID=3156878 RepID=UPI0033BBF0E2
MSFAMRMASLYMQRVSKPLMSTAQRARAQIAAPKESGTPPRKLRNRHAVRMRRFGEFACYSVLPGAGPAAHLVIYVHGGGYYREIARPHWTLISRLADAGVAVEAPLYGLAPRYSYRDAYGMLTAVYERALSEHPAAAVTIIGDSAGGGLALGFAQTLAERELPAPDRLILISPWLDLTMSENSGIYDPWLSRVGLVEAGRAWAHGTDMADPLLSPINGPLSGLPPTHVYIGTRDLLYPDVLRFRDLAAEAGADVRVTVCRNAIHVYPLVAAPEGRAATAAIIGEVTATTRSATVSTISRIERRDAAG